MRMRIASALCFSLCLICHPHPTAAQANPVSSQPPQVLSGGQPSAAKLSEVLTLLSALAAKDQTKPQQDRRVYVYPPKDGAGNLQILPPVEASQCAHITIFRAPEIDSEVIWKA